MATDRLNVDMSAPAAAVIIALLGAFVALAAIESSVAIILIIFSMIFGSEILDKLTRLLETTGDDSSDEAADENPEDALERLRTRYADGELSDGEFERRLEVLLETETVADVERYLADEGEAPRSDRRERERERDDVRDPELERSSG